MSQNLWRVGKAELDYIQQAIENGLTGKFTSLFEEMFAQKFGVDYAIAMNSGTSALHSTLGALGIAEGDEIIMPPLTFIASAYATLYLGAVPVFADVDPDTFNISAAEIRKKITSKTKAIITVSLYGLPPDLEEISNIAKQHNLLLIEDNAQCFLGKVNNRLAGTFGHASIFSLQRSKHLTTGDGGVVITNSAVVAEKIRKFADLGYAKLSAKPITNENFKETLQHPAYKRHVMLGYNFRMPEVCAAMGVAQLEKLEELVEKRTKIASCYQEVVQDCRWLVPQRIDPDKTHSWWTYAFRIDADKTSVSWEQLRAQFRKNGGDRFYAAWSLSYLEPALENMSFPESNLRYERGLCTNAEKIQPWLVQLKTNFEHLDYAKRQAEALNKTINDLQ
jgi:perosamine synthetase